MSSSTPRYQEAADRSGFNKDCPGDFRAGSSSFRAQKTQEGVKLHFTDTGHEARDVQGLAWGSHSQQLVA